MWPYLFVGCVGIVVGWCAGVFFADNSALLGIWSLGISVIVMMVTLKMLHLSVRGDRESLAKSVEGLSELSVCEQDGEDQEVPSDESFASAYGLTAREREVFSLLARGRNAGSIQSKLYISNGTVRSHMNTIYRKIGVHSQQELIDLVERSASEYPGECEQKVRMESMLP